LQPVLKVQIVHLVIEADLPAVTIPFETGTTCQSKTVPVGQSELAKIFQPFRAQSWVLQFDWLPVNFLQFPAHQHGSNGHLPSRSHAFPNHLLRVPLHFPFPEQILQFLPALLIQSHGKLLPAQGDGIAGDKDELPTIFLEDAGGAALAPAVKSM